MCACGAVLADRQESERPPSSVAERSRREASNSPWDARGVTERTADEGRARASKTRRTPERTSARSARQQRVSGVSKATTEGVTAIVPTANTHAMRTAARGCGGLQGAARFGQSGNLAATLARHAAAQGAGNDRRPFGGCCACRASAEHARKAARPAHLAGLATRTHWGAGASACRMEPVDVALQVRDLAHLVALRAADEPMSGHVLDLSQPVLAQPVRDHTCADLVHVLEPWVLLA
jgi:hypothetical protein